VAVIAGLACVAALIANARANRLAEDARRNEEKANRSATLARASQQEADQARGASEASRQAAEAEAYRAVFSQGKALRAGREPGWRDEALGELARLATSPSPKRDLLELRTEAVAALGTPDLRLVGRVATSGGTASLAFAPDGQTLITAGVQRNLEFWDVRELKHVSSADGLPAIRRRTTVRNQKLLCLPRGQGFALATQDRGVVFTDLSGRLTDRPAITNGAYAPSQFAVDAVRGLLAVHWAESAGVTVHDLNDGTIVGRFAPGACALSPDGQWLARASATTPYEVLLHRIGSDDPPKSLGRHGRAVYDLAFSPDGGTLASASSDNTAILWDVAGQRQPVVLRGHREAINGVAFSPDGGWVATASNDYTTRIWDALTGQLLTTLSGKWFVFGVAWSPDGAFLAVDDSSGYVFVYRVMGRQMFQPVARHRNGVQCVAAHPRLDRIASGADDHRVIDWDVSGAKPSARWNGNHAVWVSAVAYSPDGSLLATASGDGANFVRDSETGETKARLAGPANAAGCGLAFDASGQRLATGDRTGLVTVWDLATKRRVQQIRVGQNWILSVAFLDDGRKLVAEVADGLIGVFDVTSGAMERWIVPAGGVRRFVVDPARKRLVVGLRNGDLCSVSLPDLTLGRRLERAHATGVESLALSPDGSLLATGSGDRRVVLRDPVTFEPLLAFPEWTALVKDVVFTLGGKRLAYVGADSDVALWDLTQLREGLKPMGLAWDQPAPAAVASTRPATGRERKPPEVPTLREPTAVIDPVALERAINLLRAGAGAARAGRRADAIRDLEQARDRLRDLHKTHPRNPGPAGMLGQSLTLLGSVLRDEQRPAEATAAFKEAGEVFERLVQPSRVDLYNLACAYAGLSALIDPAAPTPPSASERTVLADRAMATLRRAVANGTLGLPGIESDRDLEPLRGRLDFRLLVLTSAGRTRETIPLLQETSAANPEDSQLSLRVAVLQAWFGQEKEYAASRRRILTTARDSADVLAPNRAARVYCLRPSTDTAGLDAALALARKGVEDGRASAWNLLALGMVEYRRGNDAAAQKAFAAAVEADQDTARMSATIAFYRAMSLFRQGKADDARKVAMAAAVDMNPLPPDEQNPPVGANGHDDLIVWMAYKEAKAMIGFDAAPPPKAGDDQE
jgi:WD40 repeat protein/tetratricopeptide (TPR) repeat protein